MLNFIDRGAFGEVTLAQHLLTRTKVAVKTTKNTSSYFMIRSKMQKEISILKPVHYPNIIKLYKVINTKKCATW